MKFSTTFLALFAAVAASTISSQVDARVGGDRDLNSNEKYTVYFANSCSNEVGVTSRGHSEVISPNSCQVFNGDQKYNDSFSYKESGSGEQGGQVSCKNIGSSNNDKCNLLGMPGNACVITIDLCGEPAPAPVQQCGRSCETTYDCSSDHGIWDKGNAWCGSSCTEGRCHPKYADCSSNSDCDQNKSVCGHQGYCVGK
jgi:hypothetical protein